MCVLHFSSLDSPSVCVCVCVHVCACTKSSLAEIKHMACNMHAGTRHDDDDDDDDHLHYPGTQDMIDNFEQYEVAYHT